MYVIRIRFIAFMLSSILLFGGCWGDNSDDIIVPQESAVVPLYSLYGIAWNDYVTDDGTDQFSASDTACDSAIDNSCLHGGLMRSMEIPGWNNCEGLTTEDELQAFTWTCDDSVTPVRFVSTAFKNDKGLSDLIDFDLGAFKENNLHVWKSSDVVSFSKSEVWWGNNIVVNNDGSDGSDMIAGEIHIITTNANTTYTIGGNKVALLVKPGLTLSGSITLNETLVSANNKEFIWIEGSFDANEDTSAITWDTVNFSVIQNVEASNATADGINLYLSSNNTLRNITANGNGGSGVYLYWWSSDNDLEGITVNGNSSVGINFSSGPSNNILKDVIASSNGVGLHLGRKAFDNRLSNIVACGNTTGIALSSDTRNNSLANIISCFNSRGISLTGAWCNILSNITSSMNSAWGVDLSSAYNNSFNNLSVSDNSSHGIYFIVKSYNTKLNNVTASDNLGNGINFNSSNISNTISGKLLVGNNSLGDLANIASNNISASIIYDVSLGGSFVDPPNKDYSLKSSDNIIRNALTIPSGYDVLVHKWNGGIDVDFLGNSVELMSDGIGNNNLLCESNETCLFTPNIAAYQGHGNLIPVGTFNDGVLSGITLFQYEFNGY